MRLKASTTSKVSLRNISLVVLAWYFIFYLENYDQADLGQDDEWQKVGQKLEGNEQVELDLDLKSSLECCWQRSKSLQQWAGIW